jgi:hypothetical protein
VSPAPISTLLLYRYHHGELAPDEALRVRAAIDDDPDVRRRWQAILAAEAESVAAPLPPALAALADRGPARSRAWLFPGLLGALALAAALVVALPLGPVAPDPAGAPSYVGFKGSLPDLEVWIATDRGPRLLRVDEAVGPGDTVQLAVHPRGAAFVSLAGRDGTGKVEIYGTVRASDPSALVVAPFALTLDEAPGPQDFFALAHDAPASEAELEASILRGDGEWRTIRLRRR